MHVLPAYIILSGLLVLTLCARHRVVVYAGSGTSVDLIEQFLSSLEKVDNEIIADKVLASYFDTDSWEGQVSMIVIPGGRDMEYLKEFSPAAINRIGRWVRERGGSLLGICAGAYFASGRVEFELFGPFEVKGKRPLALYPGVAHGAALRPFEYSWSEHKSAVNVQIRNWKSPAVASLYDAGGCYFEEGEVRKYGWTILATYTHSERPAIIYGRVGKGRVILCCPHIEVAVENLRGLSDSWMYRQMARTPKRRAALFRYIIQKLQP